MANICLYKIMVKGKKKNCYKLIDMMPLYSGEKEVLLEEGNDEEFKLIFKGDCKWSVDSYTSSKERIPYTDEEIDKIEDGDNWDIPLIEKSIVLGCDIYCNSKDIDSSCYSNYVHYNKGKKIFDECPKELHIKRGRDYDCYDDLIMTDRGLMTIDDYNGMLKKLKIVTAKVKFEKGCYWYINPQNYEIDDLVYVKGPAKEGCLGKIIEIGNMYDNWAGIEIKEKIGHAGKFYPEPIETIWKSYKPKDRKEYLKILNIDENINKKTFLNIIESRWNEFSLTNNNWEEFLKTLNK